MVANATIGGLLQNPGIRKIALDVLVRQVKPAQPIGEFASLESIIQQIDIDQVDENVRGLLPSEWPEGAIVLVSLNNGWILKGNRGYYIPKFVSRN